MLLWKIRGQNDRDHLHGWIVAGSHGEAFDIARHESAELLGEPIEWLPVSGGRVFWATSRNGSNAV